MTTRLAALVTLSILTVGCAATVANDESPRPTPPAAPAPAVVAEQTANTQTEEPVRRELPAACAEAAAEVCTPPADFTERLCQTAQPDLALTLFQKNSPWTRAWVRQPMEAWYASGARSRPMQLKYAEEVIVVANRAGGSGGVKVSGTGSYDVFRWDGTCVSLMSGELSLRSPGQADVAEIPWKRLDDDLKRKLVEDPKIAMSNDRRLEACKDDADGKKCELARVGLSRTIADYVRGGGEVPPPKLIP